MAENPTGLGDPIRIRAAHAGDIPVLRDLAGRIWRAHYPSIISPAQIEYMLEQRYSQGALESGLERGAAYHLAIVEEKPVGYLAFRAERGRLFLDKLYVLPEMHGKGLGRAMLAFVAGRARELQAGGIDLLVNKRNARAIRAYERFGFVRAESLITEIGGGYVMDDFRMVLDLALDLAPPNGDEGLRDWNRKRLAALLKLAYSGELAAAHAYQGHWKSVRDPEERRRIKAIEDEEWVHRAGVGKMLAEMGEAPSPEREAKMLRIGKAISSICRFSGRLIPMYGAGRLESSNVREYEVAAAHAAAGGFGHFVDGLLRMAEVEWEHERFFREKVLSHWLGRMLPIWKAPPPKVLIRASYSLSQNQSGGPR